MTVLLSLSPRRSRYFTQAALAACLLMAGLAYPSLGFAADETMSRIRQIEGSIDTLNRAVFKGEIPKTTSTAGTSNDYQVSVETRLSAMESQLRDILGRLERQEYDSNQTRERLQKLMTDVELRFNEKQPVPGAVDPNRQTGTLAPSDMGGAITTPATTATPPTSGGAAAPTDPNGPAPLTSPTVQNLGTMNTAPNGIPIVPSAGNDPAGQYEMAFSLLKSGNNTSAKNGFETFLATYPDHPLVPNATYWLGESYYAAGEYDKATRIFAESYKKYPKGPKVADSLLKMGMSLGASGKKKEACVAFKQLKKEFSSGDSVTLKRADQEMGRLNCGS